MVKSSLIGVMLATMITSAFANVQLKDISPAKNEQMVTISFAGDCTLGSFKGSAHKFDSYFDNYGADYFLENVRPIFENDDITFVNLEGPLTDNPQQVVKEFPMKGEPAYVDILKNSSVEIVNLSNNHILDCGEQGLRDTVDVLQHNNVNCCGEDYVTGYVVDDITVYFLGYKGWNDTTELRNKIAEDIKVCREVYGADIVCVEFHWGEERKYYPNETQKSLGRFTIDAGADVVVGAHPHVVQGIEKYNGKVIAYSLGNFCFGGNDNPKDKDSMILQVTLNKNGDILDTYVIPCTVSSVDNTNDFKPTPWYDTDKGVGILNRIIEYSAGFENKIDW